MFKKSAVLMSHLPYSLGPLSMIGRSCHIASKRDGRDGSELSCLEEHMVDF